MAEWTVDVDPEDESTVVMMMDAEAARLVAMTVETAIDLTDDGPVLELDGMPAQLRDNAEHAESAE